MLSVIRQIICTSQTTSCYILGYEIFMARILWTRPKRLLFVELVWIPCTTSVTCWASFYVKVFLLAVALLLLTSSENWKIPLKWLFLTLATFVRQELLQGSHLKRTKYGWIESQQTESTWCLFNAATEAAIEGVL